jgi:hypothetical protein
MKFKMPDGRELEGWSSEFYPMSSGGAGEPETGSRNG